MANEIWKELNHHSNMIHGGALTHQEKLDLDEEFIKNRNENEKLKKYVNWGYLLQNGYDAYRIGSLIAKAVL